MAEFIPFNIPYLSGNESEYIKSSLQSRNLCGGNQFSKKCSAWFNERLGSKMSIPTPSCTAALEMGLMIIDLQPGDEVILPSFTFTSTATAIALHRAIPVFVDVCLDTLNMDVSLIEKAVTDKTRAIIPVHYGGVSCEMTKIMEIAAKHNLIVLEDAAQCIGAQQGTDFIGSKGHMSAFSFHETKNITSGEGGMLCINSENLAQRAEIIRDKGTNRQQFVRGEIDKYSWQDKGGSYLLSDPQCAFLLSQLETVDDVTKKRKEIWSYYAEHLQDLKESGKLDYPEYKEEDNHNAHLFYIMTPSEKDAVNIQSFLKEHNIQAVSHYVPLHNSPAGKKYGRVGSDMRVTDDAPYRLLRLPLFFDLSLEEASYVCQKIHEYFERE